MLKRELVELDELLGSVRDVPVPAAPREHMTEMLSGIGVQLGLIAE
jgi:hypothetical protein